MPGPTKYDTAGIVQVLTQYLKGGAEDQYRPIVDQMNKWLRRGDGIAVYENHDFGHPDLGDRRFVSFGSVQAQLETEDPPTVLPDSPKQINWRYQLIGTYKGAALPLRPPA